MSNRSSYSDIVNAIFKERKKLRESQKNPTKSKKLLEEVDTPTIDEEDIIGDEEFSDNTPEDSPIEEPIEVIDVDDETITIVNPDEIVEVPDEELEGEDDSDDFDEDPLNGKVTEETEIDSLGVPIDATDFEESEVEEHNGEYVYTCPICGENFFSDKLIEEDEIEKNCPVCDSEMSEPILVGRIDVEGYNEAEEDLPYTEGVKRQRNLAVHTESGKLVMVSKLMKPLNECNDTKAKSSAKKVLSKKAVKSPRKINKATSVKESKEMFFNNENFNKIFTKFLKEHYQDIVKGKVSKVRMIDNSKMILECKILQRNGEITKTQMIAEDVKDLSKLRFRESALSKNKGFFLLESKTSNNEIHPQSMSYKYRVREGKELYEVYGKTRL